MNIRFSSLVLLAAALFSFLPGSRPAACADQAIEAPGETRAVNENYARIHLSFNRQEAVAVLNDTVTSRDLLRLLPLMLECGDYNHMEKLSYLPRKLDTNGAPASCEPVAGTIGYYIPWGSLAIFYHDFKPTTGLVPLGRVVSGLENLANTHGDFYLRLDRLDNGEAASPAR